MGRKHGGQPFSSSSETEPGRRRCITGGGLALLGVLLIAAAFHPVLQSTVLRWVRAFGFVTCHLLESGRRMRVAHFMAAHPRRTMCTKSTARSWRRYRFSTWQHARCVRCVVLDLEERQRSSPGVSAMLRDGRRGGKLVKVSLERRRPVARCRSSRPTHVVLFQEDAANAKANSCAASGFGWLLGVQSDDTGRQRAASGCRPHSSGFQLADGVRPLDIMH